MFTVTGAHFAETNIFLNVVSILSTFNISKAKNKNGQEVEPDVVFAGAIRSVCISITCHNEATIYPTAMQAGKTF